MPSLVHCSWLRLGLPIFCLFFGSGSSSGSEEIFRAHLSVNVVMTLAPAPSEMYQFSVWLHSSQDTTKFFFSILGRVDLTSISAPYAPFISYSIAHTSQPYRINHVTDPCRSMSPLPRPNPGFSPLLRCRYKENSGWTK